MTHNNANAPIEFIPAKCPSCGGELRVPVNIDLVKCMYCGSDVILRDSSKVVVELGIDIQKTKALAKTAENGNNFEEAYKYYTMILEQDPEHSEAWLGKGYSAGMLATFYNTRIDEVNKYFMKGLESEEKKIKVRNGRVKFYDIDSIEPVLRNIALTYYGKLISHFSDIISSSNEEYRRQEEVLLDTLGLLAQAYSLLKDNNEKVGIYNKLSLRELIRVDIKWILAIDEVLYKLDRYSRESLLEMRKLTAERVRISMFYDSELMNDPEIMRMLEEFVSVPKETSFWRKLFS